MLYLANAAPFLGMVQITVYTGAVMMLFLFVLMVVGLDSSDSLVETLRAWEAAVAKVTHWIFYFLMLAIPLTGWGMHSAGSGGKPVSMFGLFDFPALPVGSDKPTIGLFHELHEVTATAMLVLLGLHVLAALKHQFLDRDGTMARMLRFSR